MMILKILHMLALMLGAAASFGNLYLMFAKGPHDLPSPGFINQLRKAFRLSALVAIGLLWLSGLLLMLVEFGGWVGGTAFNTKIVLVAILTLIILGLNFMAPAWAKKGGPPTWVPKIHMISATVLILIVVLAVVAFQES